MEAVTVHMNEVLLGHKQSNFKHQWTLPLKDRPKGVGKMVDRRNMTGGQAKKCMKGMIQLVPLCYSPQFDKSSTNPSITRRKNADLEDKWNELLSVFVPMVERLEQREDFTDEDIADTHRLTATFMHHYVDIFGKDGVTNYIHLLGAGHITYYLLKYRNVARFSQQGWEALNQLLKQFYFNNTNQGECNGNSNGEMIRGQHLRPLMRLAMQRNLWLLGHGQRYFEEGVDVEAELLLELDTLDEANDNVL